MNKKIAMYRVIEENLDQCIRWGEFDPSPAALDAAVAALAKVLGTSTVYYEALEGDITFAASRIADLTKTQIAEFGLAPAYTSDAAVISRRRERQLLHDYALHFLAEYEHYAWELWETAPEYAP